MNFFTRSKRWIRLQLSKSQHPQSLAVVYFMALARWQLQAWCSTGLVLRAGTNPMHAIASLLPMYSILALPPPAALAHAQALVAHVHMGLVIPGLLVMSDSISARPHTYLPWMWDILHDLEHWLLLVSLAANCSPWHLNAATRRGSSPCHPPVSTGKHSYLLS